MGIIGKLYQRVNLATLSLLLAVSGMSAAMPLFLSQNVNAQSGAAVVYNALPNVIPQRSSFPSLGYEATATSEFGDSIQLGGTNRILNKVTVTMVDWAKFSDYSANPAYASNNATWSMPITLNVYSNNAGAKGQLLATTTQTFSIPWRPESDPSCGSTSNGNGWMVGGVCQDFSGIASNVTFDLSSQNVTLPNDVILGVAYNTQSYGNPRTNVAGPYNSLNVAIPDNQPVFVGHDANTDGVFWDSTYSGRTPGFAADTSWTPNGTVAFEVTATAPMPPAVPTNLSLKTSPGSVVIANNGATNSYGVVASWDAVPGVDHYVYSYWNDISSSPYDLTHPYTVSTLATSMPGVFNQGQGVHHIAISACDASGQCSNQTIFNVTYDSVPPATPILTSPANNAVVNGSSVTQSWSDASTDVDHYLYQSYNTDNTSSLRWSGTFSSTSKTATGIADGTQYWWRVAAVDHAGNVSPWSDLWKLTIDNEAPKVSISSPKNGDILHGAVNVSGTVTDTNPDRYYFVVKNSQGAVVAGPGIVNKAVVSSWSWDTTKVTDGTYTVDLEARDAAGNKDISSSAQITVEVYNAKPAILYTGSDNNGANFTPVLTASNYSTFSWTPGVTNPAGATYDATLLNPTFKVTNNGDYSFTLKVVDKVGNTSSYTYMFSYIAPVQDTPAPLAVNTATPQATNSANGTIGTAAVLGAQTAAPADATTPQTPASDTLGTPAVKGASTQLASTVTPSSSSTGLAWYWWVLIVAAVISFVWWLIARLRNRSNVA